MDILIVRQTVNTRETITNNIVVELKSPTIRLSKKEFDQVMTYMDVVSRQDEFNGDGYTWEFYLVGNDYDSTDYIKDLKEFASSKGYVEKSLVFSKRNYTIYVEPWSEILNEARIRLQFVMEKLELKKDLLEVSGKTADEIKENMMKQNTAIQPQEINLPKKGKTRNP
mgnify:FL=1